MNGDTPGRDPVAAASDRAAWFGDPLDLLTPDALCALLKVRRSWLYDAVEAGRFGDPLDLLTPDALCALLKVRRSWLYDAVEAGTLPTLRLGRQLRFRRRDVAEFIEASVAMRD